MDFPYNALSPSLRQQIEFESIDDVYDEIYRLYDEALEKDFGIGEALYTQIPFFADIGLFLDRKCQNRIKEYNFCKNFNCPPAPSLREIKATIVDDFVIIDQEYMKYTDRKNDKNASI
tara:strand:- start:147 stop:500 length:354 start_codon:yes stop_codon:yes gene_type:complete